MTFFHCADIVDSGEIKDALAVQANDASLM